MDQTFSQNCIRKKLLHFFHLNIFSFLFQFSNQDNAPSHFYDPLSFLFLHPQMNLFRFVIFFTPLLLTIYANKEAIIKSSGAMYFYDEEYTLKFELNLTTYYLNAMLLQNNTRILEKKCRDNPYIADCDFFQLRLKEIADFAVKETQYLQYNRNKRAILCLAVAWLAVTITAAIAGYFIGATISANSRIDELTEQHNFQHNFTLQQLNNGGDSLDLQNRSINVAFENLNILNTNLTDTQYIHQIIATTLLAIDKHNRDTTKFLNALGNDLKRNFFSIVDMSTFNKSLHNISNVSPIFSMHPQDIIRLSDMDSRLINETIIINVHIPLISRENFNLMYLIPIPIVRDNNNFIANIDATHLFKNNSIFLEMSLSTLAQCIHTNRIIVCNSLIKNQFLPVNNCTTAIFENRTTTAICTYRKLSYETQMIKISEESIYVHVIEPIVLRISCDQNVQLMNITKSMEIFHNKYCRIYNSLNEQTKGSLTTTIKIDSTFAEPKFEVWNNRIWNKNVVFLNQFNNEISNLFKDFKKNEMEFKQRSKLLEKSTFQFSFFDKILQFFDNFINCTIVIIITIIFIIVLIIICRCRH